MLRHTVTPLILAVSMVGPAAADAPRVAVDIPPVHSLVAQVMEGVGTPDLVLPPGLSPHDMAMRPSDAEAIASSELVVWVGPELSPAITRGVQALAQGQVLTLLDVPGTRVLGFRDEAVFVAIGSEDHDDHGHDEHDDHGEDAHHDEHDHDAEEHDDHGEDAHHDEHDHDAEEHDDHGEDADHDEEPGHDDHGHDDHADDDHGHDHDGRDPHAWLDPMNAITWVTAIAGALSEIDPENAAIYGENAEAAVARLTALNQAIDARISPLRGGSFVVFHDAYHYFEARYDAEAVGAITLGDGSLPGPRRLVEIASAVEALDVTCVFAEPQFNADMVSATLEGAGARIGVIDPLGDGLEPGPGLYGALLSGMAQSFEDCLMP